MKKVIGLFSALFIIFCFTGCEMISKFIDLDKLLELDKQEEESEEAPVFISIDFEGKDSVFEFDNDGEGFKGFTFLFKYNNGKSIVKEENTGSISPVNLSNNKISEKKRTYKSFNQIKNNDTEVTEFQIRQRASINNIKDNYARSATTSKEIITGERDSFSIIKNINNDNLPYLETSKSNGTLSKAYEGKNCWVYCSSILDSDYAKEKKYYDKIINEGYLKKVGDFFDSIYSLETDYLGSNKYTTNSTKFVNTDPKVHIIIMDINNDAKYGQDELTLGFFAPKDLTNENDSNKAQILYIDSLALLKAEKQTFSTIIHEFNHLLNEIQKDIINNQPMNTWFTEMLSMLAEDMFADKLDIPFESTPKQRLSTFQSVYYYGFTQWENNNEENNNEENNNEENNNEENNNEVDVLDFYTNTFAYGSFLIRNYGGIDLLKQIATNNFSNENSINNALRKCGYSEVFDNTVKDFYKATYNKSTSGKTFKKKVNGKDGLCFSEIKLSEIKDEDGNSAIPYYVECEDTYKLLPQGCTIHYIGEDVKSIKITKPTKNIEYEIVMCEVMPF